MHHRLQEVKRIKETSHETKQPKLSFAGVWHNDVCNSFGLCIDGFNCTSHKDLADIASHHSALIDKPQMGVPRQQQTIRYGRHR